MPPTLGLYPTQKQTKVEESWTYRKQLEAKETNEHNMGPKCMYLRAFSCVRGGFLFPSRCAHTEFYGSSIDQMQSCGSYVSKCESLYKVTFVIL